MRQRIEMAVLDPTDLYMRSRGDDWVYFSEDTHPTSYSGCVDDASAISEQEIAEFVRYANPGLFEKLKGVRFASTHLHPEQDAKPTDAVATYQHQVLETDSRGRRLLFQGDSIKTACTEESESSVEEAGLPLSIGSGDGEELGRAEQSFMLGKSLPQAVLEE